MRSSEVTKKASRRPVRGRGARASLQNFASSPAAPKYTSAAALPPFMAPVLPFTMGDKGPKVGDRWPCPR